MQPKPSSLDEAIIVGVTGHRAFGEPDKVARGIAIAFDRIESHFATQRLGVASSLAEGADRLVVEQALARYADASLIVPLPFAEDEYRKDFEGDASRQEFSRLVSRAQEVLLIAPTGDRVAAYDTAGIAVLDRSAVLIAVWDGDELNATGRVVGAARRRRLPIAWVHAGNREPGSPGATSVGRDQGVVTFENFPDPVVPEHPPLPRLVLHVGVTGHRHDDLVGCNLQEVRAVVADVLRRIRTKVEMVGGEHSGSFRGAPILRVLSRLADGSDLIVADEAVRQGYELVAVLPFERAVYEGHIASDWRHLYREMLRVAARVVELDGMPRQDGDVSSRGEALQQESYFESRRMVLRHSDVLLAVWDPENHPSQIWGTTRLVDEARHDDLLVVHLPPHEPARAHVDLREQDADIHSTSLVELESAIGKLLTPVTPTKGERNPYADFAAERQRHWTFAQAWPVFRDVMVRGYPGWPKLKVAKCEDAASSEWRPGWDTKPELPTSLRDHVDKVLLPPFAWADQLATYYSDRTRGLIVLNYLLAAAAVFFALAAYALGWTEHDHAWHDWAGAWTIGELGLILFVVASTWLGNHFGWHQRWIDYRVLAERLRLQRFLAPLGRVTPHVRRPAHLTFGDIRESWMLWYYRAFVRELGPPAQRFDPAYVEACRGAVMALVVGAGTAGAEVDAGAAGARELAGQVGWHHRNAWKFHLIQHRIHQIEKLLIVLTIAACALHVVYHAAALTLVAAAFPALGAALAGISIHIELDRVANHSRAMEARLAALAAYVARQPACSRSVAPPCEQIAECMTAEVLDWRSLFKGELPLAA